MKTFDMKELRSWNPCYDPIKHLPEDWKGSVLTILDNKSIPFEDRLWVIMRTDLVSEKLMRLFAVWCARQVQHLMKDERSLKALDVAEAFANGGATKEELTAARAAAREAAWDAAWGATRAAAREAAWAAARAAAREAAWAAAWEAAWDAAWGAQETKLREMLIQGVETGDVK